MRLILLFSVLFYWLMELHAQVMCGAGQYDLYRELLSGKSVGVVANRASVVNGVNTVDYLLSKNVHVRRVFSPEHGFRQSLDAGQSFDNSLDTVTGLPVISLYGSHKKPTAADLDGLDIVVFDLQDVGVRFFTYISTLTFVMESCAGKGIPVVVLDRPNPNCSIVDGPVLESGYTSFVGMHPIPLIYGMTIGEYASMVNGEGWLSGGISCRLTVIPVSGYQRTNLINPAVPPSPNLTSLNAIVLYPSLCLFEGTIISVGRGTDHPFEMFGHPDLTTGSFLFTPVSKPGRSLHPPFENQPCRGMDLSHYLQDSSITKGKLHLSWLIDVYQAMGARNDFFNDYFDKLAGNGTLKRQVKEGLNEAAIRASWQPDLEHFKKIRSRYLLYPD